MPKDTIKNAFVSVVTVAREAISWFWSRYIPLRKASVLDGDPGLGKSTLATDLVARATTGAPMPGMTERHEPAGAVIVSAEDDIGDTIRPRLEAAGADLSRVIALNPDVHLTVPDQISVLETACREIDARLVIIDPLSAFLPARVDAFKDTDIRRVMRPLSTMAARLNAAVLVIRHLNKKPGGSALYRGGGSIAISAAARSVLLVATDPDNEEQRVLAHVKSNLGPLQPTLLFRLVATDDEVARVEWLGTSRFSADAVLQQAENNNPGALEAACEFLGELLSVEPVPTENVKEAAGKLRISWTTLNRAKKAIGVVSRRSGLVWYWAAPDRHMRSWHSWESWQSSRGSQSQESVQGSQDHQGSHDPQEVNTPTTTADTEEVSS